MRWCGTACAILLSRTARFSRDDDDFAIAAAPGYDGKRRYASVNKQLLIDDFHSSQKLVASPRLLVLRNRCEIESEHLQIGAAAVDQTNGFFKSRAGRQVGAVFLDGTALAQGEIASAAARVGGSNRDQVG